MTSMAQHLSTLIISCSIKAYSLQDKGEEGVEKYLRILDNMSDRKRYCRKHFYDVGQDINVAGENNTSIRWDDQNLQDKGEEGVEQYLRILDNMSDRKKEILS